MIKVQKKNDLLTSANMIYKRLRDANEGDTLVISEQMFLYAKAKCEIMYKPSRYTLRLVEISLLFLVLLSTMDSLFMDVMLRETLFFDHFAIFICIYSFLS